MKNRVLLLCILSSLNLSAMENDSLSLMQKLQADKNKFEARLQINKKWLGDEHPYADGLFSKIAISHCPWEFLQYCYHQNLHERYPKAVNINKLDASFLRNKCKETMGGYSALGAAIIAKDVPITLKVSGANMISLMKSRFILQLIRRGFELTEKDKTLVALQFYDAIPAESKQIMISLLQDSQKSNLAMLPHDVRRFIVNYMICLFKERDMLFILLKRFL